MNRLQRRCVIVSAGVHLLLLLVLVAGSAFRSREASRNLGDGHTFQLVNLPWEPEAPASAQAATSPAAVPQPQQPVTRPEPPKPRVNTTLMVRDESGRTVSARQARATAFNSSVKRMFQGLSSSTSIELRPGGGAGGASDAYGQLVKAAYTSQWHPGDGEVTGPDVVTGVTVTIGNDGKVLSAKIVTPSGNERADHSVQQALDRVTQIEPFGPDATEKQRTYTINFNLRLLQE